MSEKYYGLSNWAWFDFEQGVVVTASNKNKAFRFIGQEENDWQRWSTGDTLDMFLLDHANSKFTENPGFVLAGAAQLAASGVVLLTVVLM